MRKAPVVWKLNLSSWDNEEPKGSVGDGKVTGVVVVALTEVSTYLADLDLMMTTDEGSVTGRMLYG